MSKGKNRRVPDFRVRFLNLILGFTCLLSWGGWAQTEPKISSAVDTASIRIGEQIRFQITVEADSTAQVIFPEDQTFSPLEMVEALKTDTTRRDARIVLLKTYALTQFDSGVYLLPTQRVEIDGTGYFTDSLLVSVANIPVDTTVQKMYDIKPMLEISSNPWRWLRWVGWIVLILLLAGGGYYWFFVRAKRLTPEEEEALLPPFERAMRDLKRLEDSRYLIQDEFKQYYSELTGIVRSYLEEEVHVTALESTTAQLIEKLQLLRDAGQLNLEPETLKQFQRILETADLVKFAKSKPEIGFAQQDRKAVEFIVIKTREAIPEPSEEELLELQAIRLAERSLRRRKRIWIAAASLLGFVLLTGSISIYYFGYNRVRNAFIGSPSRTLLEGEWVSSTYGFPPIVLETPEVLYRKDLALPDAQKDSILDMAIFTSNHPKANLSIGISILLLKNNQSEPDFEKSVEDVLTQIEASGARNIITKQEEFTTVAGVKGIKVYGTGRFPKPGSNEVIDGEYNILLFGGKGFIQQAFISWERGDVDSEAIVSRILQSIDVKTAL
ncbi:MAG: hypothetical protein RLZZ241_271 [Bacteroidota bacterium]|jgi:hypothetical protein